MESVVLNVRDLAQPDRSTLERVVGHQLRESQQLVIQVLTVPTPEPPGKPAATELPEWCDVYAGLSDEEVDELDHAITRSPSSRDFS